MSVRRRSTTALATLAVAAACVAAFVPPAPADGPPDDALVLGDVMRLIALDFETVRREAGDMAVDERAHANVLDATRNAQRYLRVVQRRWPKDDGFRRFARESAAAWRAAEAAATARDVGALKERIAPLAHTCKACHDVYNRPEPNARPAGRH